MLLLILGSLIVRGEEEEGESGQTVRQDRSSGNLSLSGRVKLWDRKEGRKERRNEGRKDRVGRAGGKNCAVEGDREIAVVLKSLLPPFRNPAPPLE